MRCRACDKRLNDFEMTRKSVTYEDYLDLCNDCYQHIKPDVKAIERYDLMKIDDELDTDEFSW